MSDDDLRIERPLDLLNAHKNKKVIVVLRDKDKEIVGKLLAFDLHINLAIKENGGFRFIKGDSVESVYPA